MIVDDNAEMRALIRQVLSEVAKEFVECSDGDQAVVEFEWERPDWTVMDVMLKKMDGLTATRLIRLHFPKSQVLIITQNTNPKLRDRAREAGAAGFLLKDDLTLLPDLIAGPTAPSNSGEYN